ncbi:MAG: MFS transporter [Prevotellaceae bacterium]|jgi:PAT family beta-lactamase induction signal transducer AmpG|nr:MFS transporter [Prevotellaceae bacterium]
MNKHTDPRSPWTWIPTLYLAEGLPYVAVVTVSLILYTKLGLSNAEIAFYTSWIYLPWVIKPFWSPFVDLLKTKRWWTTTMQLLIGAGLAGVALSLHAPDYVRWSLACFWLVAFSSATHDIAADGFYMLALTPREQAFYVGIRSTFYRAATIFGQGVLVMLAGWLEQRTSVKLAWSIVFYIFGGLLVAFYLYHSFILPRPADDKPAAAHLTAANLMNEFFKTFASFFRKKHIGIALLFMLLYRLPEAQLLKLIPPFLLNPASQGGLALSTTEVGLVYGTIGVIGLLLGGIIGGICAARGGLERWLWPMAWSLSLTCAVFVYLSYFPTQNLWLINGCVFVEQLGYGFGFTAYMLYLIRFSEGTYQTAHYALCTGFMAAGMMLPGLAAGWLQEQMGYRLFFLWVMLCCLATIGVTALVTRQLKTLKTPDDNESTN